MEVIYSITAAEGEAKAVEAVRLLDSMPMVWVSCEPPVLLEAARIKARFELHFTPKHGSWLNIAEIALSALARGCLARRIPDRGTLAQELRAWQRDRNQVAKGIRWQFTTADARVQLIKLYPSPQK